MRQAYLYFRWMAGGRKNSYPGLVASWHEEIFIYEHSIFQGMSIWLRVLWHSYFKRTQAKNQEQDTAYWRTGIFIQEGVEKLGEMTVLL